MTDPALAELIKPAIRTKPIKSYLIPKVYNYHIKFQPNLHGIYFFLSVLVQNIFDYKNILQLQN